MSGRHPGNDAQVVSLAFVRQRFEPDLTAVTFTDHVIPHVHVLRAAVKIGVVPKDVDGYAAKALLCRDRGTLPGCFAKTGSTEGGPLEKNLRLPFGKPQRTAQFGIRNFIGTAPKIDAAVARAKEDEAVNRRRAVEGCLKLQRFAPRHISQLVAQARVKMKQRAGAAVLKLKPG